MTPDGVTVTTNDVLDRLRSALHQARRERDEARELLSAAKASVARADREFRAAILGNPLTGSTFVLRRRGARHIERKYAFAWAETWMEHDDAHVTMHARNVRRDGTLGAEVRLFGLNPSEILWTGDVLPMDDLPKEKG